jgi:hypothetical protein
MVKHICTICLKEFNRKSNYNYHINRKIPCEKPVENAEISTTKITPNLENTESLKNITTKITPNLENTESLKNITTKITPIQNLEEIRKTCEYCKKIFSRRDAKIRHIYSRCKVKKESERLKQELYNKLVEQKEESDKLLQEKDIKLAKKNRIIKNRTKQINEITDEYKKKQIEINELQTKIKDLQQQVTIYNNTTNNNTTNNTMNNNINITLVAFGQEDLEKYITEKKIKQLIGRGFKSLEYIIEHVHFNKNKPEYHNIYLPSTKDSYIMCYNGKKWKLEQSEEKIRELIEDKESYLVDEYDKWKDQLKAGDKKKFERFMASLEDDKQNKIRRGEIKLLLYNNRDIVKETRRKIKESKMVKDTERVVEMVEV